MRVSVRRATATDAPALGRMRWQFGTERATERATEPATERPVPAPGVDRSAFIEYFTAWTIDHLGTHVPFVAEADGRIAGMAWLMLADRVPSPARMDRRTGDLQSVYVVPELRNAGVGAALIAAVLADARDRELELVTVRSASRAVPFYLRTGFRADQHWLERR